MKLLLSPPKDLLGTRTLVLILFIVASLIIIGCQGPQGSQGGTGPPGVPGLPGQDGRPGLTGLQGPVAEQGLRGPQGERGEPGLAGLQGPIGERGVEGPQGLTGERGQVGPNGERGVPGPKGEIGPAGGEDAVLQILASGLADIKARSFEVVDDLGTTRIKMTIERGWPTIELFNGEGKPTIQIMDFFGTPSITLIDPINADRIVLLRVSDGRASLLLDSGTESSTSLQQDSDVGLLTFRDGNDVFRMQIGVDSDSGQPSIFMRDANGQTRTFWTVFDSGTGQLQFLDASGTLTNFVP